MNVKERDEKIAETINNVMRGNLYPSEASACLEEISEEYATQKCREQKKIVGDHISENFHPSHTSEVISRIRYKDRDRIIELIIESPLATDQ